MHKTINDQAYKHQENLIIFPLPPPPSALMEPPLKICSHISLVNKILVSSVGNNEHLGEIGILT